MVLNLLRVEELNPEYMLERCFYQFQNQQALPAKETKLSVVASQRDAIYIEDESVRYPLSLIYLVLRIL